MRRTITALLVSLGMVLAGVFGVVSPASAAALDCASGSFCFWVDSNYSGPRYNLGAGSNANLQNNPCGGCRSSTNSGANGTWNDMASSWYNRTSKPVCVFANPGYGGSAPLRIEAGQRVSFNATWNDRMSSVRPAIYHPGAGTIVPGYSCY
ncbi:peptidase inhibitor family I36 protein [Actinoplanes philippinensis]|uniref:peptidase inhibitor family I36 protein n=1 Tax=Actinoplanes philippinensis TaxID=35752 RepID=UPI001C431180|nr:peptidase inhibitor family I36 protein [Actinoplanes philippinensis]